MDLYQRGGGGGDGGGRGGKPYYTVYSPDNQSENPVSHDVNVFLSAFLPVSHDVNVFLSAFLHRRGSVCDRF